jgi:phosphoribosylanthranilate isomerase
VVVSRLWIKICGLTTREAVSAAVASGADAVGFVFHRDSPRNLAVAGARALQGEVPPGVERVAVFLQPAQALVDEVLAEIRPDLVQADLADLLRLRLPPGQRQLPVLRGAVGPKGGLPRRVLFEGARSGSRERADWSLAAELAPIAELVLAGGLDAGNVAAAVRAVRPFGVDVSSGVESARGVKDPARIRGFIESARAAARALSIEENR